MGMDGKTQIPPEAIESVNQNKIGLKGEPDQKKFLHITELVYLNLLHICLRIVLPFNDYYLNHFDF